MSQPAEHAPSNINSSTEAETSSSSSSTSISGVPVHRLMTGGIAYELPEDSKEEYPDCEPGSGKPKGHRGGHRGSKKRVNSETKNKQSKENDTCTICLKNYQMKLEHFPVIINFTSTVYIGGIKNGVCFHFVLYVDHHIVAI